MLAARCAAFLKRTGDDARAMSRPPIHRLGRVLRQLMLLLPLLVLAAEAAEPKRVLIIHSWGRDFAPFNAIAVAFRNELARQLKQPVAFHEASLDSERLGPPSDERPFFEFIRDHHGTARIDLVVVLGRTALRFYLRHRDRLFPEAPLLVTGIAAGLLEGLQFEPRDRVVTLKADIMVIAGSILEVLPEVGALVVVQGSSRIDSLERVEYQSRLAALASRVQLIWLHDLTMEELRERVAALPPDSAIVYGHFAVDAAGVPYDNERALAAVREAAHVPVFGIYDSQLGAGIVGGPLLELRKMGEVSGQIAQRMLNGDSQAGASPLVLEAGTPVYDWRELQRWDIPESRLPPNADVRFRPPSLWEAHRLLILAGTAIVVLQAGLIAALMLQRARRRNAENEATGLSGRLLTAHEDERRHLARELHDDLTQRLARLAIDAGRIELHAGGDASEMRRDLMRLSEDVHALSYRLHPSVLDDLGLLEALRAECDRVAQHGAVQVEVDAREIPDTVSGDASLCLFRVAQEALSNATRHGRASAVTVLLSPRDSGLQLAVSDNGSGFDAAASPTHASLGLASMRERVRLLHGQLDIESTPGRGTTVVAWVPA